MIAFLNYSVDGQSVVCFNEKILQIRVGISETIDKVVFKLKTMQSTIV